jgi:phosphoenolpyruvate carboxykinase (GTP)
MADYFQHWINMGKKLKKAPKIFHVNWFRQDDQGRFLWPGFGENMRVLRWIIDRCNDRGTAVESPIGLLPAAGALDTTGLSLNGAMGELLTVLKDDWRAEVENVGEFFDKFGRRLPVEMERQRQDLVKRLG